MHSFVRVAEAGSFIAVANQLDVDRSVITRQIAALERHLGAKLITRSTRSLQLTSAGQAYLENCRTILGLVEAAESTLNAERAIPRGRIRLGLPLTFGMQRLTPALLDFARQYPQIELVMGLSDQRANLIEEGLDLSIRITRDLKPTDVVRKLGQCRLLTLASSTYLQRHALPVHPRDLSQHECLIYANDSPVTAWSYRADGQSLQVTVRGRITANNGVVLMQAAALGMGITLAPDFIAAPFLAQAQVQEILTEFEDAPLGIYAVLPSNRYLPHRVSVLMDYLAEVLNTDRL